jgi:SAM-dependent methyltransferase
MGQGPIRPNHRPHSFKLVQGVPGATSISVQRRLFDARFATRWFVGSGLDVGAGGDSLALYAELFPLMRNVVPYDAPQGNAQLLDNVEDNSFDFLYSSHCLEHLDDPYEALSHWIRVVKPSGHLIISVPDEDLYEQGVWPSRFNVGHKTSWTIDKAESWSPVSVNVVDLVHRFRGEALPIKIELIDHGYRPSLFGRGIDQTRMPTTEAAIEFVLLKLQ